MIKLTNKNVYTVTKGNRDSHSAGQTCKKKRVAFTDVMLLESVLLVACCLCPFDPFMPV